MNFVLRTPAFNPRLTHSYLFCFSEPVPKPPGVHSVLACPLWEMLVPHARRQKVVSPVQHDYLPFWPPTYFSVKLKMFIVVLFELCRAAMWALTKKVMNWNGKHCFEEASVNDGSAVICSSWIFIYILKELKRQTCFSHCIYEGGRLGLWFCLHLYLCSLVQPWEVFFSTALRSAALFSASETVAWHSMLKVAA